MGRTDKQKRDQLVKAEQATWAAYVAQKDEDGGSNAASTEKSRAAYAKWREASMALFDHDQAVKEASANAKKEAKS